jgi:tetratricopeptide (TPR) repeat protein
MKMNVLKAILVISLSVGSLSSFAQCKDWTWPEDKATAEEKNVLYGDAVRNKHYKQAIAPHQWLLTNAPNLNTSIYIQGAEIFDELADAEKDATKKQVFIDSLMIIYDMRIKNCGEEASVMARKALSYYKFNINGAKGAEVLPVMDKAFELNGNNIMDGLLVPYMQSVRISAAKFKKLTEDQILEKYDMVSAVVDAKIKKAQSEAKPIDKLKKTKDEIDAILLTLVSFDCDRVKSTLAPKFKQNPSDINLAKKIFGFMLQGKCTDDPLWLEAGEAIHNAADGQKDYGLAKNLGLRYFTMDNFEKAEFYFSEALALAPDNAAKAEMLILQGSMASRKGSKSDARELFRQAAAADPSNKDAFERIGDLYLNSFNDCKKMDSQADDRAVYLIAYDYYAKAGATQKMSAAKSNFPSKEDIFLKNYSQGQSIRVDCWINENTTIRTRD